jgi:hypothetical protein
MPLDACYNKTNLMQIKLCVFSINCRFIKNNYSINNKIILH